MDQQQYHSQTQCSPGIPLYDEPGDTWLVLIAGLLLGVDQIPFSNCEDALRSSITAPECHSYTPGKCLELASQHRLHQLLEGHRHVAQPKRDGSELIQPTVGHKCCLLSGLQAHLHLLVTGG